MAVNLSDLTFRTVLTAPSSSNINAVIDSVRNGLKKAGVIDVKINFDQSQLNQLIASTTKIRETISGIETDAKKATGSLSSLATTVDKLQRSTASTDKALRTTQESLKGTSRELKEADSLMQQFGVTAGIAGRRFLGYSVAAGAVFTLVGAFKSGITEALNFEKELVKLQQVGVGSKAELSGITEEVTKLSTSLGVSSKELIGVANILKQAGYSAGETRDILRTVAEASLAPSFSNMKDITEAVIASMSQFNITARETHQVFGAINAVSNEFAVEAKDIGDAIRRAGGSFKAVGGDINELIALFTSIRSTTRESAESIATGLRTIFTRLQRPELIDNLRQLGINLRYTREEATALGNVNLERQFVGGYEAIQRIANALKGISTTDPRFAIITEELGGYRQISKVLPLLQQQEIQQKALNVAQAGSISLTTAAEQAQASYLQSLAKVKEQFLAIFRTITDSTSFKFFLDFLSTMLGTLNQVLSLVEKITPLLIGLGTIKIAQALSPGSGLYTGVRQGFTFGATRFSTGGLVGGVGSSDTELGMLTPGEFVIPKKDVERLGLSNIKKAIKGYADGGVVGRDEETGRFRRYPTGLSSQYFLPGSQSLSRTGQTYTGGAVNLGASSSPGYPQSRNLGPTDYAGQANDMLGLESKQSKLALPQSLKLILPEKVEATVKSLIIPGETKASVQSLILPGAPTGPVAVKGQVLEANVHPFYKTLPTSPATEFNSNDPQIARLYAKTRLPTNASQFPFPIPGGGGNTSDAFSGSSLNKFTYADTRGFLDKYGQNNPAQFDKKSLLSRITGGISKDPLNLLLASTAATAAGSYISQLAPSISVDESTGRVGTGRSFAAGAVGGVGQAISGAGTGAAIGSFLPVIGPALGAAVGALVGFTTSIFDTTKKIKEANIDAEMQKFSVGLKHLNEGLGGSSTELINTIRRRRDENPDTLRTRFNNDLPNIYQFLGSSAKKLGEQGGSLGSLIGGPDSINYQFLRLIADIKGINVKEVSEEFKKAFQEGVKSTQLAAQETELRRVGLRNIASLGRISSITQQAGQNAINSSAVAGIGGIGGSGFDNLHNPSSDLFITSIKQVTSAFGDGAQDIEDTGKAYKDVFDNLAPILQQLLRGGQLGTGQDTGIQVRNQLLQRAGVTEQTASEPFKRILTEIGLNLNKGIEQNPKEFLEKATHDIDNLIKNDIVKSLKDFVQVMASGSKDITDRLNQFSTGLSSFIRQTEVILKEQFELSRTQLESQRFASEVAARAAGRSGAGLDFINVEQLQAPFLKRQENLAPGIGLDPEAIGRRLREIPDEIAAQRRIEQSNVNPDDRKNAREGIAGLESQQNKLAEALRNLADPMLRTQGLFEKLNESLRKNDALVGAYKGIFTSSPRELGRASIGLNNGLNLLNNGGNLNQLSLAQRKSVFEGLQGPFANVNLPAAGGKTGTQVLEELIKRSLPENAKGAFQAGKGEQVGLEIKIGEAFKQAEEARKQLIETEKKNQSEFYTNVQNIFQNFANDLKKLDLERNKAGLEVEKNQAGAKQAELATQLEAKNSLSGKGIDQSILNKLVKDKSLDSLLGTVNKVRDSQVENISGRFKAKEVIDSFNLSGNTPDEITDRIKKLFEKVDTVNPLSPEERKKIETGPLNPNGLAANFLLDPKFIEAFKNEFKKNIDEITAARQTKLSETENKARTDFTKDTTLVAPQNLDALKQMVDAVNKFSVNPENFSKVNVELTQLNAHLAELDAKLTSVNSKIAASPPNLPVNGVVPTFAGGGFTPRGTDTVPAMLTPREYVVNAASAQANAALLEHINAARGPVYLAEGGLADYIKGRKTRRGALTSDVFRRGGINEYGFANPEKQGIFNQFKQTGDVEQYYLGLRNSKRPTTTLDLSRSKDPQFQHVFARANQATPGFSLGLNPDSVAKPLTLYETQERARANPLSTFNAAEKRIATRQALQGAFGGTTRTNTNSGLSSGDLLSIFDNGDFRPKRFANGGFVQYRADGGNISDFINKRKADRLAGLPEPVNNGVFQGSAPILFKPVRQARPQRPVQGPKAVGGGLIPNLNQGIIRPRERGANVPGADIINRLKTRPRFDATYVNAKSQSAYSSGGFVQPIYRAEGGDVNNGGGLDFSGLSTLGSLFSNASSVFSSAVNSFSQSSDRLAQSITKFPSSITGSFSHNVIVTVNGQEALQQMIPTMENLVVAKTKEMINRYISDNIPDAGRIHD